jgi:hypothetical protein
VPPALPELGHGRPVLGGGGRLPAVEATGDFRRAVTATRLVVVWCRGCGDGRGCLRRLASLFHEW